MKKMILNALERVRTALDIVEGDLHETAPEKPYAEFKRNRELFYKRDLKLAMNELQSLEIESYYSGDEDNMGIASQIRPMLSQLSQLYEENNKAAMLSLVNKIIASASRIREQPKTRLSVPGLPREIRPAVLLDVEELEKCLNAGCYRSATILCGRILEVALHRKYFEVTGNDILETQPGIGLGKLIAKLKEKDVEFEPGITEQIHLINQVRISSVHRKQSLFTPSREQAQAMVLYTMDVLKKLFS